MHVQMMLSYLAGAYFLRLHGALCQLGLGEGRRFNKFCRGLVMLGWHLLGDEFAWMWLGDW